MSRRTRSSPSTQPLTPGEENAVRAWCLLGIDSPDPHVRRLARYVAIFFWVGLHPVCLAQKFGFHLRTDGDRLRWNRAKTLTMMDIPVPAELKPWLKEFLRQEPDTHPVTLNRLVHEAGRLMGIPHLTPRGLRHDVAARYVEKAGFSAARLYTGTTRAVLVGYAERAEAKAAMNKAATEGF